MSQKFSITANRILGALARLDDFLMNPLLQGHSGTTPVASRNALCTSQGTSENNSQNDPHPEAGFFHSQKVQNWPRGRPRHGDRSSRGSHILLPQYIFRKAEKRTALPVNRNSPVRIPLQRSKQTKFCGPFSSWQITTILLTSITRSTEFPNCQSHLPQRCPRVTGNLRSWSCLRIYSKRAPKIIIN